MNKKWIVRITIVLRLVFIAAAIICICNPDTEIAFNAAVVGLFALILSSGLLAGLQRSKKAER